MAVTSTIVQGILLGEFRANQATPNDQYRPDVARLADGGFALAYNNTSTVTGNIIRDIYNADGTPRTAFATTAQTASQAEGGPSVTTLANGNVLVAWDENGAGHSGVRGRIYAPDGTAVTGELALTGAGTQFQSPRVAALSNGGFALSVTVNDQILTAPFDSAGVQTASFLAVSATGIADDSAIAGLVGGGYVVTWTKFGTAVPQVEAAIVNADGSLRVASFPTENGSESAVAALPNGDWVQANRVTTSSGDHHIRLNLLRADGQHMEVNGVDFGSEIRTAPALTVFDNGFVLVTWTQRKALNDNDIYGRLFRTTGNDIIAVAVNGSNAPFPVTLSNTDDNAPALATLDAGRFVVAWQDDQSDGSGRQITAEIREFIRVTTGDEAGNLIQGDALREVMSGLGGNDILSGDAGADALDGGEGDDTLDGGAGDDQLDGGTGDDTAVFGGNLSSFGPQDFGNSIYVAGAEGRDTLFGMERLRFADGTIHANDGDALFDTIFYMRNSPDVFHAGLDARSHYNSHGWREGRDPNQLFDTSGYLAVNRDAAAAGVNPLEHYRSSGWREGRDPSADFDTRLYLINNPDVAAAGIDPLAHFLQAGLSEHRLAYAAVGQIHGGFDAQYYLFYNPDVAAAGIDPLTHFNTSGWQEGRNPNGWFDTAGYLAHYTDVAAAGINPLQHYRQAGWTEGRDPSAIFDTLGYLAANPDVAAAHVNPLDHFLLFGIYEGRDAIDDGVFR
jgi:Ca2+-binding RTX toxin-like protein